VLGRFLLATHVLDREELPASEVLRRYKDQARTVERGMALGMVMILALLVYAQGEWELRRRLGEDGEGCRKGRAGPPKARPALGVPALPVGAAGGARG
jgi:hypothetical protein